METTIEAWRSTVKRITAEHKICIKVRETERDLIKFELDTPSEKRWFMETIKKNFFRMLEHVPIEAVEECSFSIRNKFNPNHVEGFNINVISPPKESDRVNFNKVEIPSVEDADGKFFNRLTNNFSPDILPTQAIFVNPKPEGFGEHRYDHSFSTRDQGKITESKKSKPLTWKQYFKERGFIVKVSEKLTHTTQDYFVTVIEFKSEKEKDRYLRNSIKTYKFLVYPKEPKNISTVLRTPL